MPQANEEIPMAGTPAWEWDTWRDNRDALYRTAQALRAAAADLEHAAIVSLNDPVAALNDVRPAAHTVHDAAAALLTADDLFSEHAARLSEEG